MISLIRLNGVIKILLIVLSIVLLQATFSYGASHAFTATWTANTDGVTTSYKLYRTDLGYGTGGVRVLIDTIAHPTVTCDFNVTIPDGVSALLTFVVVATNATGDAPDSNVGTILVLFGVIKDSSPAITR